MCAEDLAPATRAVVAGRGPRRPGEPLNPPLVMASTYHLGGERAYARDDGTPSWVALEEAVGALEGGHGVVFASGMAAVAAALALVSVGGRIVAPLDCYTGTRRLLDDGASRSRWEVDFVDLAEPDRAAAAVAGAELLWLESPSNPMLVVADLERLAALARQQGATAVVDNTFATPLLQRPLALGADVVVHSVTKFIGGHSDLLLGVAVAAGAIRAAALRTHRRDHGATPGGLECFLALRGLRTLAVRLDHAQRSAAELARRLDAHSAVTRVHYPGLPSHPNHAVAARQMAGFGAVVSFEVAGDAEALCTRLGLIVHATSLGGVETTIERRAGLEQGGRVPAALLRMSVGCEDVDDLWSDLSAALAGV